MTRIDKYRALAHQLFNGIIDATELEEKVDGLDLDKKQLNLNFGGVDNGK